MPEHHLQASIHVRPAKPRIETRLLMPAVWPTYIIMTGVDGSIAMWAILSHKLMTYLH